MSGVHPIKWTHRDFNVNMQNFVPIFGQLNIPIQGVDDKFMRVVTIIYDPINKMIVKAWRGDIHPLHTAAISSPSTPKTRLVNRSTDLVKMTRAERQILQLLCIFK